MKHPKICIVGHGRHGKDTVAETLQIHYGMSFASSSEFLAERILFPLLKDEYGYNSWQDCFDDRSNHRAEWYDAIVEYVADDPAKLGREIFDGSDIYCGLRNKREFHAMRNSGVFDIAVWVDRSDHLPPEPTSSMTIEPWMADFIIDNNGSLDDLTFAVKSWFDHLMGPEVTEM